MEYRFWSNKIVNVLRTKNKNKNKILFGITGDLDNLGIFVSQQGRAVAENLVEIYNHIIGAYCSSFATERCDINDFAFLPSGEEIFAIGVADNQDVIDLLFHKLHTEINQLLKQSPIKAEYVTISFGTKIFDDIDTEHTIKVIDSGNVAEANRVFLDVMLNMRKQLAIELDKDKFRSLGCEELAVYFRNCVYAKMREYKTTTKQALTNLAQQIKCCPELKEDIKRSTLNHSYGVNEGFIKQLIHLLSANKDCL